MTFKQTLRPFAAFAAVAALSAPLAARADTMPSYAQSSGETIHGTISSVSGKYDVYVRDERGYLDHVALRDGTVINPTGITLAPGEPVTILGHNGGSVFQAQEIDVPAGEGDPGAYDVAPDAYAYPVEPYYAYPYAYGYPGYFGYPGYYGASVGFFFGGGYHGYGYGHGGYYGHGYYGHGPYGHGGYAGHGGAGFGAGPGAARGSFGHASGSAGGHAGGGGRR